MVAFAMLPRCKQPKVRKEFGDQTISRKTVKSGRVISNQAENGLKWIWRNK